MTALLVSEKNEQKEMESMRDVNENANPPAMLGRIV